MGVVAPGEKNIYTGRVAKLGVEGASGAPGSRVEGAATWRQN